MNRSNFAKLAFWLPMLFMVFFFVVPMMLTLVWSVFERTAFWMEPGFSLDAYRDFFFTARFDSFLHAVMHSAIAVVVAFVLGFPIAVFVRKSVPKAAQHKAVLLFILPFMISEVIRLFALRPVLGRNGLVNTFLMNIGVTSEPISALIYTPTGVIIGEVMSFLPFMVFCGFLAMEAVPQYVFEVCDDLGSGTMASFRRVIVPLATPGIFAGVIFIFVNGLGVFLIPDILGGPGAVNAGTLVINRLFDLTKLLEPIK